MEWTVLLDPDFETWLNEQERIVRVVIGQYVGLLIEKGPALGRPYADTISGSKLSNLKELRPQVQGEPWRVLFVFDPKRRAILLVGGNKQGDARWYKQAIRLAEQRYERHIVGMKGQE